ncbi:hypothetical protein B0H10DRAFT_2200973 [Mycena sp. CBHHK59/15]|nr:hypothetical protein B0H10DRAFT_2201268 [Mycena sp. CBHHK59/15]KAJ6561297.1 hypothetical protein B0H10DRAFT_2200973 [Mycena sp. CBHHK59/15]
MAQPAQQPNIPSIVASYGTIVQEITNISQETSLFTNVAQVNIGAQLAQLAATLNALVNTVNGNHQTVTALVNTVNANHQTAQANHAAVMQRLTKIDAYMEHQPMHLANATAFNDHPLRGPDMALLALPHPRSRDALLAFTGKCTLLSFWVVSQQCQASVNAFLAVPGNAFNLLAPALPAQPSVQERRRQLARFLGVAFE